MSNERLPWFKCEHSKLLGALAGMSPAEGYVYVVVLLRIYEVGGPCRDSIGALANRTKYNKRVVLEALDSLFKAGKLERVGADGIMNPYAAEVLEGTKSLREKRSSAGHEGGKRSAEKSQKKQRPKPSKSSDLPQANPTDLDSDLDKEGSLFSDENRVLAETKPKSDWPPDYREQFWSRYPRKEAKKAALKELDRVKKSGHPPWSVLLGGLQRYAAKVIGKEEQYIKHPKTWLTGGCWDDEPTANGAGQHGTDRGRGKQGRPENLADLALRLAGEDVPYR